MKNALLDFAALVAGEHGFSGNWKRCSPCVYRMEGTPLFIDVIDLCGAATAEKKYRIVSELCGAAKRRGKA